MLDVESLSSASLLHGDHSIRSSIAGIWSEIKELGRLFSSFNISYARTEANSEANCCAKMPSESIPVCTWVDYTPES